ncbi:MAG TPA: hypothetical protein VGY48_15630 [Vicinamibacterales bacterium]|nr:hypothetical protein [Vicinamibacterales bacterium]
MILGQTPGGVPVPLTPMSPTGPTASHPIDFTPPTPGGGNIFKLPRTGFYSQQISNNFWSNTPRMRAFPAYHPLNPNTGPQALPPIAPPPVAAAPAAPAPGPSPAGTAGAFGGSGFGSSGGVRNHYHVDPYMVMRSGNFPGISPSGRNIRAGYMNAGARVQASMPYQSAPLPPDMPPPPPVPAPGAKAPVPAATHGFGGFSWNPVHWFRRQPNHSQMITRQAHAMFGSASCEWVGPRLDGTKVQICGGRVIQVVDQSGNVLWNAYSNPDAY